MTLKASCLCGHIQMRARQRPFKIGYCHCSMCRKHTGAPYTSFSIFPAEDLSFSNQPSMYDSSAEAKRGFCPTCGTSISWHGKAWEQDIIAIQTGLFEEAETLRSTEHWFVSSGLSWVNLADGLPQSDEL